MILKIVEFILTYLNDYKEIDLVYIFDFARS